MILSLEVKNLSISYKGIAAVRNVSFSVDSGKITTIIGANGVGKSSIIKGIMGLVKPDKGEIIYKNRNITKVSASMKTKYGFSLCPEGRQLFPNMTVYENLEMGAYSRKDKNIGKDIELVFKDFPRLEERKRQKAGTLSGGEQELLAIARALMANPELLILDEPSWGLAPIMIQEVVKIIKRLNKNGMTILLIEQNANLALKLAHYGYVLDVEGIVIEGTGKELAENKEIKKIYLG